MRIMPSIRSWILTIAAIIGAICIVVFVASFVFGIKPAIVTSGSMAPGIPTGAMVFSKEAAADNAKVGDVVTVSRQDNNGLVTHRVVETDTRSGITTMTLKGDANNTNDPMPYTVTKVRIVTLSIPFLGTAAGAFKTPFGIAGIIVVVLAISAAFLWPTKKTAPPTE